MINFSNEICTENQNILFMFHNFSENRVVCEIMSKSVVKPERPQTIWRMRIERWVIKTTRANAHASTPTPTVPHTLALIRTRSHTHTHK